LKKRNKQEREGQRDMLHLMVREPEVEYNTIAARTRDIDDAPDSTIDEVQRKADQFRRLVVSPDYQHAQQVADAWCGAFVWKKQANTPFAPVTTDTIRRLEADPNALPPAQHREVERLSSQYQFFHWHLAFPEVFVKGGFDSVLGNPPWDKIQPEEEKFFSTFRPDIAHAPSAKVRKALIEDLPKDDLPSHRVWEAYKRQVDGTCHFLRTSGSLQFTGDGNLNSYRIFTELATKFTAPKGRAGLVAQTGLATDESGKELFDYLLGSGRLHRFLDFENRESFFPEVDSRMRFCLITVQGSEDASKSGSAEFGWLLHSLAELNEPGRLVRLTANDLLLFNPSSRTCPVFTSTHDVEVSRRIYQHGEHVMLDERRRFGHIDFLGELFNMTRDSALFLKGRPDNSLPLYEAKFIHQFDHRYATTNNSIVTELTEAAKRDASHIVVPKSFVNAKIVRERTVKRGIRANWLFGFRSIASPTNERTAIAAVFPFSAVGNSINLILGLGAEQTLFLMANANSFAFDFCARQKISGSNVNIWIFKQLPAIQLRAYAQPSPWIISRQTHRDWLLPRVLELTYTAWDLEPFAQDCGWSPPPFRWDDERRFLLRCELDAAFFHLYLPATADRQWKPARVSEGAVRDETPEELAELKRHFLTPRDAVAYIMDTFPIVRRKDEKKYDGDYRTKHVILEIYDAMHEAIRTGHPYQTRLDPPPADPRCCHPPREEVQV